MQLIPDLIIDVWISDKKAWATATIDEIDFVVLERIFITSELNKEGINNIVQIDIFGRHPKTGNLVVESIVASEN